MSQSDYIRLKRISQELSNIPKNLPPILTSRQYTNYVGYTLAHSVPNTKTVYSKNIPAKTTLVFDMERPNGLDCSGFEICFNTNKRPNRPIVEDISFNSCDSPAIYPKHQRTDLFRLSYPGYMHHLKSVNYINAELCNPATKEYMLSNPTPAQKWSSYAGYNDRQNAKNYAKLLEVCPSI
jgi:hypothetical protein